MPNKNPAVARERKREWYLKNKDEILKRKRERRAALRISQTPTPTQTSPDARADCKTTSTKQRSLLPIPSHASGPSALDQSRLLPPKPRPNSATAAGPSSLGQAEQTEPQSIPKIENVGGRVCSPVDRTGPWIRQGSRRRKETPKRIGRANGGTERDRKRPLTVSRR